MSIFDEFDANFDTAGLAKDAAEAAKNGNTRREVPHGTYEVEINKLELGKSKRVIPCSLAGLRFSRVSTKEA